MSQSFAELGLAADVTRAIAEAGHTQPTSIQRDAIPLILQGRDVLASARSGSGKTAAFILPLLQRLNDTPPETLVPHVRALVITPSRDIAQQVENCVRDLGCYLDLRVTAIYGGANMGPQIEALREGVEILVATPGRLLDHLNEQTVDLSHVEMLVLDEADRIVETGFLPDLQRVLGMLPQQRQTILFAETVSEAINTLADSLLHERAEVSTQGLPPQNVPVAVDTSRVTQRALPTGQDRKRALLTHLIKKGDWKKVLVFTRTKHGANRLAHQLGRGGISTTAIHGNKVQGTRIKALDDFRNGKVRVLVATDLAAGALGVDDLAHVVNYDLPQVAADYLQRIARSGPDGEVIVLLAPEDQLQLVEIEKLLGMTLEQTPVPGFEPGSVPPHLLRQQQRQQQQQQQQRQQHAEVVQPDAVERDGGRRRRGRNRHNPNGQQGDQLGVPRDGTGSMPGLQARQVQLLNVQRMPRQERNEPNGNRANGQQRRAPRQDDDNRGNRDTSRRDRRNVILDDDFGNRIQPAKVNRSIRMRIAMGDIDEELDNIGNRLPSPRQPRKLEDEDEINYNVALPSQDLPHEFDDRQPMSNATQMFPSSARFLGDGSRARGANGNGNGNGSGRRKRRRGGAANGGAQTLGKGQQPRQGQLHHPQQRHARHQQGKKGNRQGGNRGQARQERRSGNP